MTKRSLRPTTHSLDTTITVAHADCASAAAVHYVFGDALGSQTGSIDYVEFIMPGVLIMTVGGGIAYAALRLSMDLQKSIIGRFRTMPVGPLVRSERSDTVLDAFESGLLRPGAAGGVLGRIPPAVGVEAWLWFIGLLALFTLATTWMAMFFELFAKTPEGVGAFAYILLLRCSSARRSCPPTRRRHCPRSGSLGPMWT